jgi:hypothetical protein
MRGTFENLEGIVRSREQQAQHLLSEREKTSSAKREQEQREIEKLLTEIEEHLKANELDDARVKCHLVLRLDELNRDARVYLDQIRRKERDLEKAATAGSEDVRR